MDKCRRQCLTRSDTVAKVRTEVDDGSRVRETEDTAEDTVGKSRGTPEDDEEDNDEDKRGRDKAKDRWDGTAKRLIVLWYERTKEGDLCCEGNTDEETVPRKVELSVEKDETEEEEGKVRNDDGDVDTVKDEEQLDSWSRSADTRDRGEMYVDEEDDTEPLFNRKVDDEVRRNEGDGKELFIAEKIIPPTPPLQ